MIVVAFEELVKVCGSAGRAVKILLGYEEYSSSRERELAQSLRRMLVAKIRGLEEELSLERPRKKRSWSR